MRRQDLLEQRRSGPRQADDKYRVRRLVTAARSPLEEFRRADVPLGFQVLRHLLRFVGGLQFLQPVALLVIMEGRREVALVLVGLAQRKIEVNAVHVRQVAVALLRVHLLDLGIAERIDLEVGQRVVRFAMMRAAFDRRLICVDGILVITAGLERMSLGRQRDGVGRELRENFVECR